MDKPLIGFYVFTSNSVLFDDLTVVDVRADEIFENLPDAVPAIHSKRHLKCRFARWDNAYYTILAATRDADFISSSKKFIKAVDLFDQIFARQQLVLSRISKEAQAETNRLIHNLESLSGHISQEVFAIADQGKLSSLKWREQVEFVEAQVAKSKNAVALCLLAIGQNNSAIGYEISIHRKLRVSNPRMNTDTHTVHKVVMNVLYQFFSDFIDKDVDVIVHPSDLQAKFDYESVRVALYHLVQNAAKYIQPTTPLNIRFTSVDSDVRITFDMHSVQIQKDESTKIFEAGYSGRVAEKFKKSGTGQGMYIVRKLAELNGGKIEVQQVSQLQIVDGQPYQNNLFDLFLPAS